MEVTTPRSKNLPHLPCRQAGITQINAESK